MRVFIRFLMIFLMLSTALLLTPIASASCGSPPDPRVNTSGYASWCQSWVFVGKAKG